MKTSKLHRAKEALRNIIKHQEELSTGNFKAYRFTGAWQIATKALTELDKQDK